MLRVARAGALRSGLFQRGPAQQASLRRIAESSSLSRLPQRCLHCAHVWRATEEQTPQTSVAASVASSAPVDASAAATTAAAASSLPSADTSSAPPIDLLLSDPVDDASAIAELTGPPLRHHDRDAYRGGGAPPPPLPPPATISNAERITLQRQLRTELPLFSRLAMDARLVQSATAVLAAEDAADASDVTSVAPVQDFECSFVRASYAYRCAVLLLDFIPGWLVSDAARMQIARELLEDTVQLCTRALQAVMPPPPGSDSAAAAASQSSPASAPAAAETTQPDTVSAAPVTSEPLNQPAETSSSVAASEATQSKIPAHSEPQAQTPLLQPASPRPLPLSEIATCWHMLLDSHARLGQRPEAKRTAEAWRQWATEMKEAALSPTPVDVAVCLARLHGELEEWGSLQIQQRAIVTSSLAATATKGTQPSAEHVVLPLLALSHAALARERPNSTEALLLAKHAVQTLLSLAGRVMYDAAVTHPFSAPLSEYDLAQLRTSVASDVNAATLQAANIGGCSLQQLLAPESLQCVRDAMERATAGAGGTSNPMAVLRVVQLYGLAAATFQQLAWTLEEMNSSAEAKRAFAFAQELSDSAFSLATNTKVTPPLLVSRQNISTPSSSAAALPYAREMRRSELPPSVRRLMRIRFALLLSFVMLPLVGIMLYTVGWETEEEQAERRMREARARHADETAYRRGGAPVVHMFPPAGKKIHAAQRDKLLRQLSRDVPIDPQQKQLILARLGQLAQEHTPEAQALYAECIAEFARLVAAGSASPYRQLATSLAGSRPLHPGSIALLSTNSSLSAYRKASLLLDAPCQWDADDDVRLGVARDLLEECIALSRRELAEAESEQTKHSHPVDKSTTKPSSANVAHLRTHAILVDSLARLGGPLDAVARAGEAWINASPSQDAVSHVSAALAQVHAARREWPEFASAQRVRLLATLDASEPVRLVDARGGAAKKTTLAADTSCTVWAEAVKVFSALSHASLQQQRRRWFSHPPSDALQYAQDALAVVLSEASDEKLRAQIRAAVSTPTTPVPRIGSVPDSELLSEVQLQRALYHARFVYLTVGLPASQVVAAAYQQLGLAHEALGHGELALRAFECAVRIATNSEATPEEKQFAGMASSPTLPPAATVT